MSSTRLAIGLIAVVLCSALMISIPHAVQAAPENQPEMRSALENLHQAQRNLEAASHDKGGHRAKALEHVRQAINEVEQGIQFDNHH